MSMNRRTKNYITSTSRGLRLITKNQLTNETSTFDAAKDTDRIIEEYVNEMPKTRDILLAPYTYTRSLSIASAIPKVFEGFNYWMKIPDEKFETIKDVMYLAYDAITMFDDVIDDSDLRRNYPTALRVYGPDRTWLATYSIVLIAIEKLLAINETKSISGICKNFIIMHSALANLFHITNYSGYPSRDEYFKIVLGKTAIMHSVFLGVMQGCTSCDEKWKNTDLSRLIALIGLWSQADNDIMNLSERSIVNGKINAEDITAGIFTLPMVLAVDKNNLDADTVFHIVRQKSKDSFMKDYCVELIYKLGAMKDSEKIERALYKELMDEIERLGGNPILVNLFNSLHTIKFKKTHFPNVSVESKS